MSPALTAPLPQQVRKRMAGNGGRLCLSGAAAGADALWSKLAWSRGDAVVHWSFGGHRHAACAGAVVALSAQDLASADVDLRRAARVLRRPWPPRSAYTADLLRRNYFQALFADALYAVTQFDEGGGIVGGTAWAVQLFVDRFTRRAIYSEGEDPDGFTRCEAPAYVFDQQAERWLWWTADGWADLGLPPQPFEIWAGIGTRRLNEAGAGAMAQVLGLDLD